MFFWLGTFLTFTDVFWKHWGCFLKVCLCLRHFWNHFETAHNKSVHENRDTSTHVDGSLGGCFLLKCLVAVLAALMDGFDPLKLSNGWSTMHILMCHKPEERTDQDISKLLGCYMCVESALHDFLHALASSWPSQLASGMDTVQPAHC